MGDPIFGKSEGIGQVIVRILLDAWRRTQIGGDDED